MAVYRLKIKKKNCFKTNFKEIKKKKLLVTVFSTVPGSALNVPPQTLSSQVVGNGILSATRAHPIKSQSFIHALGAVPDPTIAGICEFELPDIVNDRDLLLSEIF